ncbi:hypothetical protein [Winogradskyella eximia]|uniref:hypothetical protein n=1 Tax=Winogradskyella eximia TaxID=262006 RepID=UPI0024921DEE|nr:hypothetical protein [Winogradskyella eximia]
MSKLNLSKYSDSLKENTTLVFFIQRLNELLFDYTLDTFKPRALNTILLCEELLNVIEEIEKQIIDEKNIEHIFNELKWSFKSDPVAKEIIGDRRNDYLDSVDIKDLPKLKLSISLLKNKLGDFNYLDKSKETIISLIQTKSPEKRKIEKITSSLITGLIDLGYNKSYIHKKFNEYFVRFDGVRNDLDFINDFFNSFNYQNQNFTVVFKAQIFFEKFKDSCQSFRLSITHDLSSYFAKESLNDYCKGFIDKKRHNQVYIVAENIIELDEESARLEVLGRIEKISNLFVFFHHKQNPTWNSTGLLITVDDEDSIVDSTIISSSTPILHKTLDLTPSKASVELKKVLKKFGLESSSFRRFDTAIDLHASAVKNTEIQNQLLNLWIALETLITPNKSKSKIQNYSEIITNFLVYDYLERIFRYVTKALIRESNGLRAILTDNISGVMPLHEKVAILIVSPEYEELREQVYEKLENNELLIYRIKKLNKDFGKGKDVKKFIETHIFKTRLQLNRIYRTRNLIVHSGRVPSFTENLTENLHNYVDSFLKRIIDFSLENKRVNSIEQACLEMELLVSRYLKNIEANKDETITKENIESILFGIK